MGFILPKEIVIDGATVIPAYITKWNQVATAKWFALPLPPKEIFSNIRFRLDAIIPMCIMFIVTAVETIGDTSGVVEGHLRRGGRRPQPCPHG